MCNVSSKITQKAESEKRDAATVRNERNCTRVRYGEKSGGNKKIKEYPTVSKHKKIRRRIEEEEQQRQEVRREKNKNIRYPGPGRVRILHTDTYNCILYIYFMIYGGCTCTHSTVS